MRSSRGPRQAGWRNAGYGGQGRRLLVLSRLLDGRDGLRGRRGAEPPAPRRRVRETIARRCRVAVADVYVSRSPFCRSRSGATQSASMKIPVHRLDPELPLPGQRIRRRRRRSLCPHRSSARAGGRGRWCRRVSPLRIPEGHVGLVAPRIGPGGSPRHRRGQRARRRRCRLSRRDQCRC